MANVVFFTTNNARVERMEEVDGLEGNANVAINPDMKKVEGTPPHYWKLVKGKVLPMSDAEKADRDAHIALHGVDNVVRVNVKTHRRSYKKLRAKVPPFLVGLALGLLAWKLMR
jgi:hypothetical protein